MLTVAAFFLGLVLYRMRGGAPPKLPRIVDLFLFSAPLALSGFLFGSPLWALGLSLALTMLALSKGHGAYMDLDYEKRPERRLWEESWIGSWLSIIYPKKVRRGSRASYESLALGFTGFFVTLPMGIVAMIYLDFFTGVALALSGFLKTLAYQIGWKLYSLYGPVGPKHLSFGTPLGEALTGGFLYSAAALLLPL